MDLYKDIAMQPHTLIAGKTGSGKSVVINGVLYTALQSSPAIVQLILIDPKRVELSWYKQLPHTIAYASEPQEFAPAIMKALQIIDDRCKYMEGKRIRQYDGGHVYVVIDELADIMTDKNTRRACEPLIQRIGQIGRCANVHLIMATQCPLSSVISTPIKVNVTPLGLKTRNAQDSRNIVGRSGCEALPSHGTGIYVTPDYDGFVSIPYIPDCDIQARIDDWVHRYTLRRSQIQSNSKKGMLSRLLKR